MGVYDIRGALLGSLLQGILLFGGSFLGFLTGAIRCSTANSAILMKEEMRWFCLLTNSTDIIGHMINPAYSEVVQVNMLWCRYVLFLKRPLCPNKPAAQ